MAVTRLYHGGTKIEGNKVLKNDLFHGTSYIVVPGVEFTKIEYDG